jgi:hypothetical protein
MRSSRASKQEPGRDTPPHEIRRADDDAAAGVRRADDDAAAGVRRADDDAAAGDWPRHEPPLKRRMEKLT